MKAEILLTKRTVNGKRSYYAKMLDEATDDYKWKSVAVLKKELGKKASHLSTTSKAGAETIVRLWIKEGIPSSSENLINYLLAFWSDGSAYIEGREVRGKPLSTEYKRNSYNMINTHVKDYFESKYKRMTIHQVTTEHFEKMVLFMSKKGLSNKRINDLLKACSVPLSEAVRLRKIRLNPVLSVEKLPVKKAVRELFTMKEARDFFIKLNENDDKRFLGVNMLSASTGMRLGECIGLKKENILEDEIRVTDNWQRSEGLKAPKWGSARSVPVPSKTKEILKEIADISFNKSPFVFYSLKFPDQPMGARTVQNNFKLTCNAIGIKEADRVRRGLTFHSWRHWYDSALDGKISAEARRNLTGHSDDKMDKIYLHITEEQKKAVKDIAEGLF